MHQQPASTHHNLSASTHSNPHQNTNLNLPASTHLNLPAETHPNPNQNMPAPTTDYTMEDNNEAASNTFQFTVSEMERNNIVMLEPHKIWTDNTNNQCYANQNQFQFHNQFSDTITVPIANEQQFCKCFEKQQYSQRNNNNNNNNFNQQNVRFSQFSSQMGGNQLLSFPQNITFETMDLDNKGIEQKESEDQTFQTYSHNQSIGLDEYAIIRKPRKPKHSHSSTSTPSSSTDCNDSSDYFSNAKRIQPSGRVILYDWFIQHIEWPYPNPQDKSALAKLCKQNVKQIDQWFSNRRRRTLWKSEKEKAIRQLKYLKERAESICVHEKTKRKEMLSTDSPYSQMETTQSLDLSEEISNKPEQCHSLPELSGFDNPHSMSSDYLTPSNSMLSLSSENGLQSYVLPKPIQTHPQAKILSPQQTHQSHQSLQSLQSHHNFFQPQNSYNPSSSSSSCPTSSSSYFQMEDKTQQEVMNDNQYEKEESNIGDFDQKIESDTGAEPAYYGNPPIVREPAWFDGDTPNNTHGKISKRIF